MSQPVPDSQVSRTGLHTVQTPSPDARSLHPLHGSAQRDRASQLENVLNKGSSPLLPIDMSRDRFLKGQESVVNCLFLGSHSAHPSIKLKTWRRKRREKIEKSPGEELALQDGVCLTSDDLSSFLGLDVGEGKGKEVQRIGMEWRPEKFVHCYAGELDSLLLDKYGHQRDRYCGASLPQSVQASLVNVCPEPSHAARLVAHSTVSLRVFKRACTQHSLPQSVQASLVNVCPEPSHAARLVAHTAQSPSECSSEPEPSHAACLVAHTAQSPSECSSEPGKRLPRTFTRRSSCSTQHSLPQSVQASLVNVFPESSHAARLSAHSTVSL
ncbi:hypothetical protein RRG08_007055 [Elysia crispata]|uniref:Uncharacterized protein n=1 Tax=Elysia crispata TaxID=231223 RepID=A0AAE1DGT3_9GAST|nr:hypothetical protein RRG08_007055 [Elysia crispata]